MNYIKQYNLLIQSRLKLDRSNFEPKAIAKHHIIPKSVGGSDCGSNLVVLTHREHYLAHLLLAKEEKKRGIYGYNSLSCFYISSKSKVLIKSRSYQYLRERVSEVSSLRNKSYYESLSYDDKEKIKLKKSKSMLEYWDNLNEKDYKDRCAKNGNQVWSDDARERLSLKKRRSNWMKGKKHSEDTKKRISAKTKGTNNPMYGKKMDNYQKIKMSVGKNPKRAIQRQKMLIGDFYGLWYFILFNMKDFRKEWFKQKCRDIYGKNLDKKEIKEILDAQRSKMSPSDFLSGIKI